MDERLAVVEQKLNIWRAVRMWFSFSLCRLALPVTLFTVPPIPPQGDFPCSIHQNAILLVDALDVQVNYKELMSELVCSPENAECMIHRCEKCPGSENLRKYIKKFISEKDELVSLVIII